MSLWAKISSLGEECLGKIQLTLYNNDKEHQQNYKFPIQVRYLFADVIENAVCGGNIKSVESGLDPHGPEHAGPIIEFLALLISQIEERLVNAQHGDLFFTRVRLTDALENLKENKERDPIGIFKHIRDRINAEIAVVAQYEPVDLFNDMPIEPDPTLQNIQDVKLKVVEVTGILNDINENEKSIQLNYNRQQQCQAILTNPEQLQNSIQQIPDYETQLRQYLSCWDSCLEQNMQLYQDLMQQFEQKILNNINDISILQEHVSGKLEIWKHEQQRMANGIQNMVHSVSLNKLQIWSEELAKLTWKSFEQLTEAERIMGQKGLVPNNDLVAGQTYVRRLLQTLLNDTLIVENQPFQIIYTNKIKSPETVVVSLLIGKQLKIDMHNPQLSTFIITEKQARSLPVTDNMPLNPAGKIINGCVLMSRDELERTTFKLTNMHLAGIQKRENVPNERVSEKKYCLYFECLVTVGPLQFKVSTISLPVVVIYHSSQEVLAIPTIAWDNAFGEIGRVPFEVPSTVPWAGVAEILNTKFLDVTGRGLTEHNLEVLAKKALRKPNPHPEDTITWSKLCKENLPGRDFTFWAWFHANLYKLLYHENDLKTLWKEGLIMGFIEKESSVSLLSVHQIGTFLLRFSESILGAITITLLVRPGYVTSVEPTQMQLLLKSKPMPILIKDMKTLVFLCQSNRSAPKSKNEAFGKFYLQTQTQTAKTQNVPTEPVKKTPYVELILNPSFPGDDNDSNIPNGSNATENIVSNSSVQSDIANLRNPEIAPTICEPLYQLLNQEIPNTMHISSYDENMYLPNYYEEVDSRMGNLYLTDAPVVSVLPIRDGGDGGNVSFNSLQGPAAQLSSTASGSEIMGTVSGANDVQMEEHL